MKLVVKCPYCGKENYYDLDKVSTTPEQDFFSCEDDYMDDYDGPIEGCGKLFVVNYKAKLLSEIYKLEKVETNES